MTPMSASAASLVQLLDLQHPPVAVTFGTEPDDLTGEGIPAQPAGCCFWEPAQRQRLDTRGADHANCSVGSYTHGFTDLASAAAGSDTAALINSGWIAPSDFASVAHLPIRPSTIRYEPLSDATDPDVVLIRLSPTSLMTLQGACPEMRLTTKPQCQIIPRAHSGQIAVSPGCAVSRARTGLPADEVTCALPGGSLEALIDRLRQSVAADQAVVDYATNERERFSALS
ncbi:DUF169 domain-containing protein [Streptomyces sp. NPDC090493]|uniref:DUF169 domain-containing protein n=1 Tax=Streptomyces sp. NPDC090493 TaxID=3365964 RepID=UPI0038129BCB